MKSGLGGRADKTKDDLEAAASAITFLRGEVRPHPSAIRHCERTSLRAQCAESSLARAA